MDFAITENCFAEGWCAAMAPYVAAGKAVLAAKCDLPPGRRPALCAEARTLGLSLLFVGRALDRPGVPCG